MQNCKNTRISLHPPCVFICELQWVEGDPRHSLRQINSKRNSPLHASVLKTRFNSTFVSNNDLLSVECFISLLFHKVVSF